MMWVGDYRQKAPAAACDLKNGRKVLVGGSPAWRLPKIERDRDQSRRSQAAPPRRPGGICGPEPVALHRCKKEQGREGSKRRFDLTYAPPSKDTGSCSRQLNRTRPGECRVCCGFRALEMDAGRVWKPLTTTRGGSAEKAAGVRTRKSCCGLRLRLEIRLRLGGWWCPVWGRAPSSMVGGLGVAGSAFQVALAGVAVVVAVELRWPRGSEGPGLRVNQV